MNDSHIDILYVEDDPLAVRLLEEACRSSQQSIRVHPARTEDEVVDALSGDDPDVDPDLLLLSLELTGISGLEMLKRVRELVDIQSLPVIVFSNSDDIDVVVESYENGADAYIEKPPNFNELLTVVRELVTLPQHADFAEFNPNMAYYQPQQKRA